MHDKQSDGRRNEDPRLVCEFFNKVGRSPVTGISGIVRGGMLKVSSRIVTSG